MSTLHKFILWLLLSTVNVGEANKDVTQQERRTRATTKTSTNVVNLDLSAEEKVGKKTLEEVHAYAELKHDPRASFPDSFTVCSIIMATDFDDPPWVPFFNILNQNGGQFLVPLLRQGDIESLFGIRFHEGLTSQWIRDAPQQKKRENVGIFPKWGTPPPPPPCLGITFFFFKKILVYFAF